MSIYKKATRCQLRIPTKFGALAVEQLWSLPIGDLSEVVKTAYANKKKYSETDDELSFLNDNANSTKDNKEVVMAELTFDIVMDVYTTRIEESNEAIASSEKKKELARIEEAIRKKKNEALDNMSIEELEAMANKINAGK